MRWLIQVPPRLLRRHPFRFIREGREPVKMDCESAALIASWLAINVSRRRRSVAVNLSREMY